MAAWPDVLRAQQHAHAAAAFEYLDPHTAREIEAVAAQIIPSTDGPGAREAGVIYFIDRALASFATDDRETYRSGIAYVQDERKKLFPESSSIASLSDPQQMSLVRSIEKSKFFDLLQTHTVLGFLGSPSYGGNREGIGWKQIGFENRMVWEHPFGYYDRGDAT
jgi:gluconate 2-dehydrogenase gamma chain